MGIAHDRTYVQSIFTMLYVAALPHYHLVFARSRSPPLPLPSDREFVGLRQCDQRRLQVATATAALVEFDWFDVSVTSGERCAIWHDRSGAAEVGRSKRAWFVSRLLRAFASFGWAITTDSTASIISSDSLSSRATVVTPSFALSSVCLAYAPTVADFPWVSYLLISKGILLITSVTTTATTVNLGGCIHDDDGGSFCFSDDDRTPRIWTAISRVVRPPFIHRDV